MQWCNGETKKKAMKLLTDEDMKINAEEVMKRRTDDEIKRWSVKTFTLVCGSIKSVLFPNITMQVVSTGQHKITQNR